MDTNLISQCRHKKYPKAFADKPKKAVLPTISPNQTAYVKIRCISKSGTMITDITDICQKETWLTIDIETKWGDN